MAKQKNRVISFFNQSQAETCKITQFPPEIISTKLSKLLRYNIIQTLVVPGNVVDVSVVADGFEVATGTFNLAFLRTTELTILQIDSATKYMCLTLPSLKATA